MSLKLYEIANEYRVLLSIMESNDEDGIDADSFLLAIADIQAEFAVKALNIACLIKELTAESLAVSDTAKSLQSRSRQLDSRIDRLRTYLHEQMQASGIHSAADERIKLTLKKNPPAVRIDDPESLPVDYCRVIPQRTEPDKTAIKTALKSGINIPGCSLIQTTRLDIQ